MVIPNPFKNSASEEEFRKIREGFAKIRETLDEHLDSINQNTNEIQANYEHLCRVEAKLDALKEVVESILLRLNELGSIEGPKTERINLSHDEKRVFLAIYKYSGQNKFISYSEIAKRLGLSISLVRFYVTNLIEKGVPILKKYQNREVLVSLELEFRERQAKENIVNINESITRYI